MAFDPNSDLGEIDTLSLRAEKQQIYEGLSTGPRDRSPELTKLRDEAERTKESIGRQRAFAADSEKKLGSMSAIAKARRKWEVDQLRRRISDANRVEERLSNMLREMANEEKQLIRAQKERDQWAKQQSPLVERAQAIESELAHRSRALLRDRENSLPKYLESAVGPVPERPSEKYEWRQTVLTIEDYREKYGIKDRNRALGGEPRSAEQLQEKERIERDIDDRRERRHGRSRDDDFGMERSLELSP